VSDMTADSLSDAAAPRHTIRAHLDQLVRRALAACSATALVAAWRSGRAQGISRYPTGVRWQGALAAVRSAFDRQIEGAPDGTTCFHLSPAQLIPLLAALTAPDQRFDAIAVRHATGDCRNTIIIVAPHGRPLPELEAIARLAADRCLEIVAANERGRDRDFWRQRALAAADRLACVNATLDQAIVERRRVERAVAAAASLRARNRFDGLGTIAARFGPFGAWIVAATGSDGLRIAAASPGLARLPRLDTDSAIADCMRRNSTIARAPASVRAAVYHEDRLFARFAAYLCVPFETGAFALAAREPIGPEVVASLESLAARLAPLTRLWLAEDDAARLRRLVRHLGLRMFGAIDTERARIARDLHDDQAQLLAAARIALAAGPGAARAIFKQLENALRLRVRELRPATLGRATLDQALRAELRRFDGTATKCRLLHPELMSALPRPVQQLCCQIAREALSNVLRHAAATRVEIAVEHRANSAFLTIVDNGRGIDHAATDRNGMGLEGLAERLQLMGGKLTIHSRPGSTRLAAEIPHLL
jgi:signal transduction histidine kinase